MVKRDYKFYLVFENSLGRDYVTEKFYNPLLYSTVPVVYSGADYETIKAPRHSFIDVRDFSIGNSPTISLQHRFIIFLLSKFSKLSTAKPLTPTATKCRFLFTHVALLYLERSLNLIIS